uniref:ATPase AAA-type core domain-containing protein n=1 Tax=Parascaris equorum TaxID=6256 RepID=A0A914RUI9_PAREQ
MACKELGLQFVEMNASDARNKKFLESKAAELIGCHQIDEYFGGKAKKVTKADELGHVLIMDEVDGMSGNEDRAGVSCLLYFISYWFVFTRCSFPMPQSAITFFVWMIR